MATVCLDNMSAGRIGSRDSEKLHRKCCNAKIRVGIAPDIGVRKGLMVTGTDDLLSERAQPLPCPPSLGDIPDMALFLDFDGTLVEIAPHPDAIEVASDLSDLLRRLDERLSGRLALVSGRSLADLEKHLGPIDIAVAGSHGGEFRPAGSSEVHPLSDPLPRDVLDGISAISEELGGLLVEPKPFSAAIHYRAKPETEADVLERTSLLAAKAGLTLKRGKMVAELVMPGSDKGSAVKRFMEMPVFNGFKPIFVGDDITDEDAFKSVRQMQGGGVLVGPMRMTEALWQIPCVSAVHDWLRASLA